MKRIISFMLCIIIIMVFPCNIKAENGKKKIDDIKYLPIQMMKADKQKGEYKESGSKQYVSVIEDNGCLMIDICWICKKMGLICKKNGDATIYTIKKSEKARSVLFSVGKSKANVVDNFFGDFDIELGGKVEKKGGNVYVPFVMFVNIFDGVYKIKDKVLYLFPPQETVMDISSNFLDNSAYHYDVVGDSGLSKFQTAVGAGYRNFYRKIKSLFQGTVSLDAATIKKGLPGNKDVISDTLALSYCTINQDEIDAVNTELSFQGTILELILDMDSKISDAAKKSSKEAYMQIIESWLKDEKYFKANPFSSKEQYIEYVANASKKLKKAEFNNYINSKGAEFLDNSINVSKVFLSGLIEYCVLTNEISNVEQESVDASKAFFQYLKNNDSLTEDKVVKNILDKIKLYDGKNTNIFKNEKFLDSLCKNVFSQSVSVAADKEISRLGENTVNSNSLDNFDEILLQLQLVSIGWDFTETIVNKFTGDSLAAQDALYAAVYCNVLEGDAVSAVFDAKNNGDIEKYRDYEWFRLKTYYQIRQYILSFYKPQKSRHPKEYKIIKDEIDKDSEKLLHQMAVLKKGIIGATKKSLDAVYKEVDSENKQLKSILLKVSPDEIKEEYKSKVEELEKNYGKLTLDSANARLTGVVFLQLLDFDEDGTDELVTVVGKDENYKFIIYGYDDSHDCVTEISNHKLNWRNYYLMFTLLISSEVNNKYVINQNEEGNVVSDKLYSVKHNDEKIIKEFAYDEADNKYYIDNKEISNEQYLSKFNECRKSAVEYWIGTDGDMDNEFKEEIQKTYNMTNKTRKLLGFSNEIDKVNVPADLNGTWNNTSASCMSEVIAITFSDDNEVKISCARARYYGNYSESNNNISITLNDASYYSNVTVKWSYNQKPDIKVSCRLTSDNILKTTVTYEDSGTTSIYYLERQ